MDTEVNNNLKQYQKNTFEDIKHTDELGNEYWYARELMEVLGYGKWGNFKMLLKNLKKHVKIVVLKF